MPVMHPRLALIGKGRWGSVIKKTLLAMPECELAYEATRDWQTLLEKDDIDGVIVATPPGTHAEIALAFIKRGIPVFIEKPMTTSVEEAKRIEATARETGVPVMVGHIHLYNPAFLKAKEIARACGPVRILIGEGANNGPFREEYSTLWDWAPHDLSTILAVLGEWPKTVSAWGVASTRPGTTLWDSAQMKLVFPSGAVALISSTWLSPEKRKRITVVGEKSSVVYDDVLPEHKVAFYEDMGPLVANGKLVYQEPTISHPSYDSTLPLTCEMHAFLETIKTKKSPESDAELGLHIVTLLDAAERSIASGNSAVEV